jgi:hypothetical protein
MTPGGTFYPLHQPGRGGLIDLTEEGEGDMPGFPVGPAEIVPAGPERLDHGVELVKDGRRGSDGHEQAHRLARGRTGSGRPVGSLVRPVR